MKVLIGVDPHKGSHTAVAIDHDEVPLGQLRVRATRMQCEQLLEWAEVFPERRWAIESAGGLFTSCSSRRRGVIQGHLTDDREVPILTT